MLYVGEVTLPFGSVSAHSTQTYGESYRWGSADYKDTFDYVAGDRVTVCLTDAAPIVTLVLTPDSISESGASNSSTVTATVEQASADPFTVTVSAEPVSPAGTGNLTLSENKVLTFPANATVSTGAVTITAVNNDVDAPDKTVTVKGELSSGARPTAPDDVTLTITDDDDPPELELSDVTVTEGTDAEFEVRLGAASEREVTVTYATTDDTAEEPDDYGAVSGTLTFEAGDRAKTITVTTLDDMVDEADGEEFTVTLSSPVNATLETTGTTATGTINDNDDPAVLSIRDATAVIEGGTASFEVSLGAASEREVTVAYASGDTDDTAKSPADYGAVSGTLTFEAGDRAKTITVTTLDDTVDEADAEEFTVTLSSPVNATLETTGTTATGTINDNDDPAMLSIRDATAVIEGGTAEFEVSLGAASEREVTVTYASGDTDDTAKSPADYGAVSGTLTFEAGDRAKTITVTTVDDALDEADAEEFTVTLSGAVNATLSGDVSELSATGTITDDEALPVLRITDATVTEGTAAEFEVSLGAASEREVTVTYASGDTDDTAKSPADYGAVSGTLTFEAGDREKTITVTTVNDALDEADTEGFTVTLSSPVNATLATTGTTARGTINDNDRAPVLTVADVTVTEGADAEFEVSLGAASEREVTVTYASGDTDDTAKSPADYGAVSGTLTFEAGDRAKTITVTTLDDTVDEADGEEFTVTLSSPVNATLETTGTTATGTINDNDDPAMLSIRDATAVIEGGTAEFEVSLGAASEREVTVTYASGDTDDTAKSPADYGAVSGTLTFEAGDRAKTITVTTVDDALDEADAEEFTVTLSGAVNATLSGDVSELSATGTITDDEALPVLRITDATVTEGTAAEFEVSLGAASEREVTVTYASGDTDDTAKSPADYGAVSGTLTFEAGDRAKTITVTTVNDALDEADTEGFTVTLSSPVNATLATTGTTARGTINDNDRAPVLTVADVTVTEGADAEFEVSLGAASEREVTVTYASGDTDDTAKSPADYGAVSGTLTFEAGDRAKTITVTTVNDALDEADTEGFTVSLSSPVNATLATTGATATGTINDNDDPAVLAITDAQAVIEGVVVLFVVSMGASEREVTVTYASGDTDDTAKSPADYGAVSGTLTFEAGDRAKTITVTTVDDALDEADTEEFTVTLSGAVNATLATTGTTATGTINDNDDPAVLSIRDATAVIEGGTASFEVSLGAASEREVTVAYASGDTDDTAKSPADYGAVSGTLTFEAGDRAKTITVTTLDDTVDEADAEEFTVTLSGAVNATLSGDVSELSATGTITDDEALPVLRITDATVTEGTAAEFEVSLGAASEREVTVTYASGDTDDTAKSPADYGAVSGTLTFEAGDRAKTITVTTVDDALDEADAEEFTVTLSGAVNATLSGDVSELSATGTITDDEALPVLRITDATVTEGADAEFEVSLGAASEREVTVTYASGDTDDTAKSPADYGAVSGTLTFEAGDRAKTITVTTVNDALDEADTEGFTVTLSSPVNATLATTGTTARGTINDNDRAPVLTVADVTVTEGADAEFEVSLGAASEREVTVTYASGDTDDTAKSPADYGAVSGTLTFEAGDRAKTITVTTVNDALDEADTEGFTVSLSSPVNATLATTGATATGTINDNDDPAVLAITDAQAVIEGVVVLFVVSMGASEREVTVTYASGDTDDTAKSPADYGAVSGTLTFEAGDRAKTITVTTVNDALDEADTEEFTVTLSGAVNATLATTGTTATGTINDNDDPAVLSIRDATAVIEGGTASFEVSLGAASEREVTVTYASGDTDDTAKSPADYGAVSGTLTFEAGDRAKTITVTTVDDALDEADAEEFTVTLSGAVNATLSGDVSELSATGTITDDEALPVLRITDATVTEGTAAEFEVSLGAASEREVTVTYASGDTDDTAKSPADYGAVSGTLTFEAGDRAKTITVTTVDDTVDEADTEGFTVTLSGAVNATLSGDVSELSATGTITDDEALPVLRITDATVTEGTAAEFEVSLGAASEREVTVTYASGDTDDTAKSPADYGAVSGTLTFEAGDRAKTITVTTVDDTVDEADTEGFTVTLSGAVNATLSGDVSELSATGTITDDEALPVLRITDATVTEGTAAEFEVSLGAASEREVTVTYASGDTDDTAKSPADYGAVSGTLTFEAGDRAKTITVTTVDDALDEADAEEFTVTLSGAVNATLSGDVSELSATGTITDDEALPVLRITDATVTEGTAAEFEVSLGAASEREVTVTYASGDTDDTAKSPADYGAVSGTLTFEAGDRAKTITVTTVDDTVDEADTEGFTVTLSGAVNATLSGDVSELSATGTITDDEALPVLRITDATVTEGTAAEFEVSLGAASEREVTVTYASGDTDDTAKSPADYGAVSGTLTFEAGDRAKTITVTTVNDTVDEADAEEFTVTLSGAVNATLSGDVSELSATGTITDDEALPVLRITDATVTEGADAEFEVSLGAASEREVTVTYASGDTDDTAKSPADYGAVSGTLTFEAGDRAKTITVTTVNDTVDEADAEEFTVTLSGAVNATLSGDVSELSATGTITDDEALPVLRITDATVTEGADAEFEVSLGAASEREVTVTYASGDTDDTAKSPADYGAVSGTLTFEAGDRAKTITVTTVDDALDEADTEEFTVTLSSPVNATLETTGTTATGTINDNDDPAVLSIRDATAVIEGGTASFEVSLGAASEREVTVAYASGDTDDTAKSPADYGAVSGTLTFEAGDRAKTITVTTLDDTVDEADGEEFTVTLSSPVNATLETTGTTATGTINDNDDPAMLSIRDATAVIEGGTASFEVSLGAASEREVTVAYASGDTDDTAKSPADYRAVSGTLTFEAGDRAKTITVTTVNDMVDEADGEEFTVTLSSPVNATLETTGTTATGTINDNDDPAVLSIRDATAVIEGGTASFEVSLGAASEREVTVTYASGDTDDTAKSPADYGAVSGTLTFEAGDRAKTITVTTVDDALDEADAEEFTVTLSSPVNATLATTGTTARGTINDNDRAPVLTVADVTVTEGADAEFEVSLGAASEREVTVTYASGDTDDTAKSPADYGAVSGTLTFEAGDRAKTITVTTVNDTVDEADAEEFTVTLSGAVNATLSGDVSELSATGTITDDEALPVLRITDATVTEGADAEFEVSLGAASEREVTVTYASGDTDDTAKSPADYGAVSGTLTFEAGDRAKTITVTTVNDTVDEADAEEFTVTLSGAVNATLSGDVSELSATGTITDDEALPVLRITDATVTEGADAEFEVSLGAASEREVTVTYASGDTDDTAKSPADYGAVSGTLTFEAGDRAKTITVTTVDDALDEADTEEFTVTLSGAVNATLATTGTTATGTINDNDDPAVLSIRDATAVIEGGTASFEVSLGAASEREVTVAYASGDTDDTAKSPADYGAVSGTLTFEAGDRAKTITVTTLDDMVDEADGEEFTVTLSSPVNATLETTGTTATGTINDNDDPAVLSIRDATAVIEGGTASFEVSLGAASEREVTVAYASGDTDDTAKSPADYGAVSGTLTFEAGDRAKTITVTTLDDTVDEADGEEFTVTLSSPVNATLETTGTTATGTINDNDDPAMLSIRDATAVIEGGTASFEVSLGAASEREVTVAYASGDTDDTAKSPADYRAVSGTLTFEAGDRAKTITVTTVNDMVDEADGEEFTVTLSSPVNATLETTGTTATGTINDNDDPAVLSIRDATAVIEGGTASFEVSLGAASEREVTVTYASGDTDDTAKSPADYGAVSGTLTFEAGDRAKTITVTTVDDALDEADAEEFTVTLSSPVNATLATTGTTARGTINDNDRAPVLTVADVTVTEGADAEFEVSLGAASEREVTVTYASGDTDDTAKSPADYGAVSGTLTFEAGDRAKTITVTTVDDALDEADTEGFTVTLSSPVNATLETTTGTTVTGTITDGDALSAEVSADAPSVAEGDDALFTVTLQDAQSTADVVVEYTVDETATATAGEDYTAPSRKLTIKSGQASGKITIATLDTDEVVDPGETLVVKLTGASTDGRTVAVDTSAKVTTTIADDAKVKVSVQAVTVEDDPATLDVDEEDDKSIVGEGQSAMFEVLLSGKVASEVKVSYSTGADDDTAEAGTGKDYTAATGKLTFAANETSKTVEVATLEDDLNEADETFTLTITAPDPPVAGVSLGTSSATGTITDTDALSVSVTADQTSVNEGETATFTVTLPEDSTSTAEVVVNYEVGGSATGGEDYTEPSQTLAIAAGAASGTISIVTLEDQILESDQTVTVTLESAASSGRPVTVDMTEAVVTIVNTTTGGFVLKDPASEANGNTANVQVSPTTRRSVAAEEAGQAVEVIRKNTVVACTFPCILEGTSATRAVKLEDEHANAVRLGMGETVVASYRTSDRTATAGDDYTALTGTLTLTYDNTKTDDVLPEITFETKEDSLEEDDEMFRFTIDPANLPGGGQTQTFIAELTIRDDDSPGQGTRPRVTFSSPDYTRTTSPFTLAMTFLPSSVLGVTGFDLEDIQTTNGTAADFSGSGRSYSVQITPDDGFRGDLIVAVPANVAYSVAHPTMGNVGARVRLPVDTTATVPDVVEVDVSFGVATYTALEDGAPATVTVLLSADPERRLVVPLTARNGNGASDDDYSGVPEQVTFASGQTSTTFTVTATSDIDEDAGETVTLGFGELPAAVSTGSPDRATITLAGESSKTRYARVMRTLLPRAAAAMSDATVGAISNRIDNVGSQGNLSLAGVNVLPSASVAAQERSADAISWASRDQTTRNISSAQLMDGSSFVMTLADRARLAGAADPSGSNPGTAALWGSGDYRNLAGSQNALAWRGNLVSLHLGADLVALPELVAGVAVARSLVGFDYTDRTNPRTVTGKFETDLLSVHPYASWTPVFGLGFWATGGVGWGGVGIDDNLDVRRTSTTRLLTGALGGSSRLLSVDGLIPGGATALRLKGEGFVTQTLAEENGPIVAQDVGVQRVRLALEGSHEQRGLWGSILTPALEVGLRHDGGDAAQGAGLELGGELRYVHPQLGLTVEGRGRVLTTHRAATEEWGVGGKIQLELGADRQGLSLSLAPSLGVAASGTHTLWQQGVVLGSPLGLPSSGVTDVTSRLDAQADYGLLAMGGQGMLTPYGGFSLAGRAGRDYRAGARLETDTFNLSLEGMRSERDSGVVDHGLTVQGAIRF